jgi:hypothetical protein
MARAAVLPEVELVVLDDGRGNPSCAEPAHGGWMAATLSGTQRAGIVLATVIVLAAGALTTGREAGPPDVTATPVPRPGVEPIDPRIGSIKDGPTVGAAVVDPDEGGFQVYSRWWWGHKRVRPALGAVRGVVAREGYVAVALSSGEARRYDNAADDGVTLGPADVLLPAARHDQLWLVLDRPGQSAVQLVAPDAGSGGDQRGVSVAVPDGWIVAGSLGEQLVLQRRGEVRDVAVWRPVPGAEPAVSPGARVVATTDGAVALLRGDHLVVADVEQPFLERSLPALDVAGPGSFSPDGRWLALQVRVGGGVAVVTLDRRGPGVPNEILEADDVVQLGWSDEGDLVVATPTLTSLAHPETGRVVTRLQWTPLP